MKPIIKIVTTLSLIIFAAVLVTVLKRELVITAKYIEYFKYVYAAIILIGGIIITRQISLLIIEYLKLKLKEQALIIGNSISIIGYIISITTTVAYVTSLPEAWLAGATFSGLIIGLAVQPILSNFFSGILMLLTGMVKPGSRIRILTSNIPFQIANLPAYKYFSYDFVYAGYMGTVLEVSLFYTKIISEEGQIIKIPNTILATNSGVVEYIKDQDYIFNVRYEFPIIYDPETVLMKINESLKDMPVLSVKIDEQSDKEYYLVKIVVNTKNYEYSELKSEILKRLIKIHKKMRMEHTKQLA
ncbi:MAG: mechanosensitive ion channel family protein [Candidatus Bathyarchaeia archaeon]|nr:mechanosensitive ion channel family protein [Candidatus Bathyarchaeota archaeon]